MPRRSRHRSHGSGKRSRERSDSEEDGTSRGRKSSVEERVASPGASVSRDLESEKRSSLRVCDGKEMAVTSSGDSSGEFGKKRK